MRGLAAMVALTAALAVPVRGQQLPATPVLPAQHWAFEVLRRLETIVQIQPRDAGASTLTHGEVIRRLRLVRENARDSAIARLAGGYLERFLEEFSLSGSPVQLYESNVGAQYVNITGRAAPGSGYIRDEDWTGAKPLSDVSQNTGMIRAAGTLGFVAVQLNAAGNRDDVIWDETHGLLRLGPLEFWGGRRGIRLGPASGLVLSGNAQIDGGGFELSRAVRLPWILRHVGPFHFEAFGSRLTQNGRRNRPWFWGARGSLQPLPYLTLGVNRSAIFGGEGHPADVLDILQMVAGGLRRAVRRLREPGCFPRCAARHCRAATDRVLRRMGCRRWVRHVEESPRDHGWLDDSDVSRAAVGLRWRRVYHGFPQAGVLQHLLVPQRVLPRLLVEG